MTASYRRIGVLKCIGFAPAQVTATCRAQLGVPAFVRALARTALGNRWARPLIDTGPFHISVGVPVWITVSVPLGLCALAGLTSVIPAVRAGRLSAVQALTAGQAPRPGHGYAAHRQAPGSRCPARCRSAWPRRSLGPAARLRRSPSSRSV